MVEIDVPEGASDEEVERLVVEMTARLDAADRALGGDGLVLRDLEIEDDAPVGEGVLG